MNCKFKIIIPVLNGGKVWKHCVVSLLQQSVAVEDVLVIDSGSDDGSLELAQSTGFDVIQIDKREFNHGGTRQLGVRQIGNVDIVVFLTQDAILSSPNSVIHLVSAFEDSAVGVAYGRQLPRIKAGAIEQHSRVFNYPEESRTKSLEDAVELGIKTAFVSNSFAAYRCEALIEIGGFPSNTILSEDTYVAAKMLLNGWKVKYSADAEVFHSHDYSYFEEFRRYFDIGVFHSRESWIREELGRAEGEGARYVKSELRFLFANSPLLIPSALLRTVIKFFGYRLGLSEAAMPLKLKSFLSMHHRYWVNKKV